MPLDINPPPGTRFPNFGDEDLPFAPKGALRGKVDWSDFLAYHSPSKRKFTLLATHETWISAAACFEARQEDLVIDYLARNDLFRPPTIVSGGSVLVAAMENIAEQLQVDDLRLESVDDPATLHWYELQGFIPEGASRSEDEWGVLHPMVKRVEPFGRG